MWPPTVNDGKWTVTAAFGWKRRGSHWKVGRSRIREREKARIVVTVVVRIEGRKTRHHFAAEHLRRELEVLVDGFQLIGAADRDAAADIGHQHVGVCRGPLNTQLTRHSGEQRHRKH